MDPHLVADKSSLSGIRKSIRADMTSAGHDPCASFDCLVAVTEACTNALIHARADDEPDPQVRWEIDPECARFYVRDFCTKEWSKNSHPSRVEPELSNGYGLTVMSGLMDEIDIDVGPQGTTVSMTKHFR